jgi:hypothetical protein
MDHLLAVYIVQKFAIWGREKRFAIWGREIFKEKVQNLKGN